MKKSWKPMVNCLVMLLAVALFAAGCAPSNRTVGEATPEITGAANDQSQADTTPSVDVETQPSTGEPDASTGVTTETTQPDNGGFMQGWTTPTIGEVLEDGAVTQLRLSQRTSGWWNAFANGESYFFVAESVDDLAQGLRNRGINPEELDLGTFDEAYFRENRLVVIPRASNTGSVRYGCGIASEDGGARLTVTAQVPELSTADMADFLVMVSVSLADYPTGTEITVDPSGNPTGGTGSGLVTE